MSKFETYLPKELQNIICEYANVKYRNGQFITQIAKNDYRRDIVKTIYRPLLFPDGSLHFFDKRRMFAFQSPPSEWATFFEHLRSNDTATLGNYLYNLNLQAELEHHQNTN